MTILRNASLTLLAALFAVSVHAAEPIPVKVVVVTMFETGEDSGDDAGEFQRWNERQKLDKVFPAPHMHHDLHMNE